ncbi:MAG: LysR family transcriptional regulator [Rhodospirillales bacterium]
MELYQVRYFLALCETLNFTRAAEKCAVSQPSLTRAIQNLEGEFGGPLFHRERQRTHLTELGLMMQPYFEQVFGQAQAAKDAAKTYARLDDIPLKLGLMCTIGRTSSPAFSATSRDRNPGVELQLLDADGPCAQRDAAAGGDRGGDLRGAGRIDERLHALPLFDERFVMPARRRIILPKGT